MVTRRIGRGPWRDVLDNIFNRRNRGGVHPVIRAAAADLSLDLDDYQAIQWLKLDATGIRSSGRLRDFSTTGTYRDPLVASCLDLNGSTGYLADADASHPLTGATAATLAGWVKLDTLANNQVIFSADDGSGSATVDLGFSGTTGRLQIIVAGSGVLIDVGDALTTGTWFHVAATLQQSGSDVAVQLFKNGTLVKSGTIASRTLSTSFGDVFQIGAKRVSSGSQSQFLDGKAQDAHLYDAVMADAYIAALADVDVPPTIQTANLMAWYPLEDREGTVAYDSSGSGNHLDHNGGVTHTADGVRCWANELGYETIALLPANSELPAITGSPSLDQELSLSNGTWSNADSYTYQWRRDGANIAGATANTYTLVAADVGTDIDAVVTATNAAGSASATAAEVGPIVEVNVYTVASQSDLDNLPTLVDGDIVRINRGLTLRGSVYSNPSGSVNNVTVEAVGVGAAPILDCSDIIEAGDWTDNGDGTWSCTVEIDEAKWGGTTTLPVAYQDGRQLIRRVDAAGVTSGAAGGYWSQYANAGTDLGGGIRACTVTIKPFSGSGPILGSEEFAVSVRGCSVAGPNNWTVRGLHCRRPASLRGAIDLGQGALVERCVFEWGTKHNWQIESGTVRDTISVNIADGGSGEAGNGGTFGVFYRADATGLNWTMQRCGFVQEAAYTVSNGGLQSGAIGLLFHDNGGTPYQNIASEQCWGVRTNGVISGSPAGTILHVGNFCKNSANLVLHSLGNPTITHCLHDATSYAGRMVSDTRAGQTWTLRNCAHAGTFTGASLVYGITASPTLIDVQKCSIYTPTDNEGVFARRLSTAAPLTLKYNHHCTNIIHVRCQTGSTFDIDYNYYWDSQNNRNQFQVDGGTTYTTLAAWQAGEGQDANSLAGKGTTLPSGAGFSGNPLLGDFRRTPGSDPANIGAGCDEHWDWNARAVAAGAPYAWPTVPETLADALTYIADPAAWDFYP